MIQILEANEVIEKWGTPEMGKLSVANIEDPDIQYATARLLENTEKYYKRDGIGLLMEGPTSVAPVSQATGQFQPISLALARRVTPDLFAWKCVPVHPMNGPVGLAYAMRFYYQGTTKEANFDDMNYFSTFSGNLSGTSGASDTGTGVSLATAEAWALGDTTNPTPQLVYAMSRVAIEANTRKIGANVSLEAMMDIKAMHNVDVKQNMVKKLKDQVVGEIDRELLQNMKTQAVATANGGEALSVWQTSATDGRWQGEKFATVGNAIIQKANDVGTSTRVNPANFCVVSQRVATALQAIPVIFTAHQARVGAIGTTSMANIGTLNGMTVYVDRFAVNDYALVGLKGADQDEGGIIYSPYVMGLESEATDPNNFSSKVGVMNRYAITASLLGAGRYYRHILFANLNTMTQF